jgi:hypothetical protein
MVVVAIAGAAAWLIVTAVGVVHDPNYQTLSHVRMRLDNREVVTHSHPIEGVFWSQYRRRLLGQPWPGSFACPSCLEKYERIEGRKLLDLATSDDSGEMLSLMSRIDREREQARMKGLLEQAGR